MLGDLQKLRLQKLYASVLILLERDFFSQSLIWNTVLASQRKPSSEAFSELIWIWNYTGFNSEISNTGPVLWVQISPDSDIFRVQLCRMGGLHDILCFRVDFFLLKGTVFFPYWDNRKRPLRSWYYNPISCNNTTYYIYCIFIGIVEIFLP